MTAVDPDVEQPETAAWPAEPWPLRRAPEHLRPYFLYVGAWLGVFCYMAVIFGSLVGFTVLPLVLAAFGTDTWIARVVLSLQRLTGPGWFLPVYMAVMWALFCLLLYGMQIALFIRIRYGKKYFDRPHAGRDASPRDPADPLRGPPAIEKGSRSRRGREPNRQLS